MMLAGSPEPVLTICLGAKRQTNQGLLLAEISLAMILTIYYSLLNPDLRLSGTFALVRTIL